jgi:ZIP family zinc transporter
MIATLEGLISTWGPIGTGTAASFLAGLAAGLGALPVLALRNVSQRGVDILLGFAAGVMLAATVFSLVAPALEIAGGEGSRVWTAASIVGFGLLGGGAAVWAVHRLLPHTHFIKGREGPDARSWSRIWLFIAAITLHNFPEGLAVGVAFGGEDLGNALAVLAGIFLQNLPEGFVVALALLPLGYGRGAAIGVATLTGLVETLGGLVGISAVTFAVELLPWGLAVAAGAMLFVISHEVIPETHRNGFETPATFGLLAGFIVMMTLDTALAA